MAGSAPLVIPGAVEGPSDETVMRRLIEEVGAQPGTIYGKNGKKWLRDRIGGFNQAAQRAPGLFWLTSTRRHPVLRPCVSSGYPPQPPRCASGLPYARWNPGFWPIVSGWPRS